MRNILSILLLCFLTNAGFSQKLDLQLDHVNPILKNDKHGDSVRKYFSNTFYTYPKTDTSLQINKTHTRHLLMTAYYSNGLGVSYVYVLNKIPQLTKYSNDNFAFGEMNFMDAYSGSHAIPIFDTTGIIITVNGINRQNVDKYQYRVLENKTKVVLPWTKPKLFTNAYWQSRIADSTKIDTSAAYLGQFKDSFGNALTIQVRRVDQPQVMQVSMSAFWAKRTPKVISVFTFNQLESFLKIVKRQWMPVVSPSDGEWSKDSVLLRLKHNFQSTENSLIFYLDGIVNHKELLEYELINNGSSAGWQKNDLDLNLIWLKDLSPGNYKLRIRYSVQRANVCEYSFMIKAAWYQTIWAKLAFFMLGLFAVGFVFLLIRSRNQSKKMEAQDLQKQLVQTELKAIRMQFNPHFVFNALSSIQGLITKNDPDNASKYLVEFGTLMRESLKATSKEFTSLVSEIKMLENYLKLEKLRFGFEYRFEIDEHLAINEIEIPSLLLQPIIENAIKHGISALQEQGRLIIAFDKADADMVVTVTDNGDGFKDEQPAAGFGLQLTRDRIKLLNQTFDHQQITFAIKRADEQTHVIICFKNLLI
jgi:two-component system LytT family sensor kinase